MSMEDPGKFGIFLMRNEWMREAWEYPTRF